MNRSSNSYTLSARKNFDRKIMSIMKTTRSNKWLHACMSFRFFLVMVVPFLLLNGCSGGLKITSDWQQGEMIIDGSDSEWQNDLYYDKESDMAYSVRNDDRYVYVFLKVQNRSTQMQILRQGLTVWFDREDGKHQVFGIHYPMSHQGPPAGFSPDSSEEKFLTFPEQTFPELEIIGPKKEDIQRFSPLEVPGIQVKLGRTRETLVYELRVPLKKASGYPFAIEPISAHRIGIEFETGEFRDGQNKSRMNEGRGLDRGGEMGEENPLNGGSPGRGRGSRGGGRQGGRLGNFEKTKQVELWLSVQLANK
jgi:hypothetical protein